MDGMFFCCNIAEFRGVYEEALKWYESSNYLALFVFCSSLDPQDREITELVAANKEYIDSLTGDNILYLFFNNSEDNINRDFNSSDIRFVDKIKRLCHEDSHSVNIKTTLDICRRYGINRELLPALILVKGRDEIEIFPVNNYSDIETYLYAAHFVSDFYNNCSNCDSGNYYDYNQRKLLAKQSAEKMSETLNLDEERILSLFDFFRHCHGSGKETREFFCKVLIGVLRAVGESKVILNRKLQQLKDKINNFGYDTFISCKSEDYDYAYEIFSLLERSGKKPFLADPSMRKFKHDDYGDVIRGVVDICDTMIVFTTNPAYPDTPYVRYEWTVFSNDVNTGKKQGKLLTVIPSDLSPNDLPIGLRHVEAFKIHLDEERLLEYINESCPLQAEQQKIITPTGLADMPYTKKTWFDKLFALLHLDKG